MMKKYGIVLFIGLLFLLTGCQSGSTDDLKTQILSEIDFYLEVNDYIHNTHSANLDDVEEKLSYQKEDFIYFDQKSTKNVEIEYDDFYVTFTNLVFVKEVIRNIDEFQLEQYFENTVSDEVLYVSYEDEVLIIDYYENLPDLDILMRHTYQLQTINEKAKLVKYIHIFDKITERTLVQKKIEVFDQQEITNIEYYPGSDAFMYEYISYDNQEYFKYRGTMGVEQNYIRETVEYYLQDYSTYVSYDIKDDTLEDYRIKFFRNGHRVVKIDVNVKDNNPTVNELTWNLLEVDGWDSIELFGETFNLYQNNIQIMNDYSFEVQRSGYGKVTAYKMFEGELTDQDISLSNYGLNPRYSLISALIARDSFVENYIQEMANYGFVLSDISNRDDVFNMVSNPLSLNRWTMFVGEHK